MPDFYIKRYTPGIRKDIVLLMIEFGDYIEKIDDLDETEYKDGSAEYFTDKMVRDVNENNGAIFVGYMDNKAVGFIGGYKSKQNKNEKMESIRLTPGVVNEFFVTTSSRGKSIGKKLLLTLEKYLKSQGCDIIRLEVFAPNLLARNFYQKHGFKERLITLSKQLHSL